MVSRRRASAVTCAFGLAARLLLDAAPPPLVGVEGTTAMALNRAARELFGTEDRILPSPAALFERSVSHFRLSGRRWRVDRVDLASGGGAGRPWRLWSTSNKRSARPRRA